MAQEKSGSAGAEKPPEKPWPVIEPTIKDLTYAEKSPSQAQRLQDALLKAGAKSTRRYCMGLGTRTPRSWRLR